MSEFAFRSLLDVSEALQARKLSPVELTQSMLRRIEQIDGDLRSYVQVCDTLALEAAKRAEEEIGRGEIRGPLHGVPVAVKDLCAMEGTHTRAGSPYRDWKPGFEASVVVRLREAGAVILGKLQLSEGAFSTHHPDVAPPLNPWGAEYWTGVSSSGSGAATAAGLCFASLGTDTGGSIRFPSHCCGVTGLKPTWGRVSRAGVFALADSLDHIGPIARSAGDAAAVLGVLAGPDPKDPTAAPVPVPDYLAGLDGSLKGLRVGFDERYCSEGIAPEVASALADACTLLAARGADVVPVRVPSGREVARQWVLLCAIETARAHAEWYPSRKEEYGPILAAIIELGRNAGAPDIANAQALRREFSGTLAHLFQDLDAYLSPSMPKLTQTLEEMAVTLQGDVSDSILYTSPTDASGHPAICLPGGFSDDAIPYGFQIVGRPFGEADLLRLGHAYQLDTGWHARHPSV